MPTTSFQVAFNRPVAGFDPAIGGLALAEHQDWLNQVCDEARLEQLDDFFSVSATELREAFGGSFPEGVSDEEEEWFPTADGVSWITDVRSALADHADDPRQAAVLADLDRLERVLTEAGKRTLTWHLKRQGE